MRLVIPHIPASPNRWNGKHWSVYRRSRKLWDRLVWGAMAQVGAKAERLPKATVRIVRQASRKLDKDNLYGACKPVVDALKANWLILDDSPEHIELTVAQRVGRPSLTEITVEGA